MASHPPQNHQPGGPGFRDPLFDLITGRTKPGEVQGDITTDVPSALDVLNGNGLANYRTRRRPPSLTGTFFKGVGEGALHPVRALVGRPDAEEELPDGWTLGHTIANFSGEIGGIGLSFIPFLKATQIGLKGIGLGRVVAGGFTRTPAFAIAEGTISGAAFEAGSDFHEDLGTRMAMGAGLGLAAEAVLLGVSRAWRGHWGTNTGGRRGLNEFPETRPERLLSAGPTTRTPGAQYSVNPNAIALEKNLHPEGAPTLEEALTRFRLIETHTEQLQDAAARVAQQFRPFGIGILTGITDPGKTIRALRKQLPWSDVHMILRVAEPQGSSATRVVPTSVQQTLKENWATTWEGQSGLPNPYDKLPAWDVNAQGKPMYEIFLMDKKVRTDLELLNIGEETIESVFMGKGPVPAYEEVMRILRGPNDPTEITPIITIHEVNKARMKELYPAGAQGVAVPPGSVNPPGNSIYVREGTEAYNSAKERVATLVHEYMHHFSWSRALKETDSLGVNLFEVVLGREGVIASTSEELLKLKAQARELTLEVLKWEGYSRTAAIHQYDTYSSGVQHLYYQRDTELLSRAVEVMLVRPGIAKELAPDLTKALGEMIQKESPKLKTILSRTELKRVHAILTGLWKKSDDGASSIFHRPSFEFTPEHAKQFEEFGAFVGMGVKHEGADWVVDGIAGRIRLIGQAAGDRYVIRNPMTGVTKNVHRSEVHRPLMAQVAERNRDVIKRVRDLLKAPAKWLGVVLRDTPVTNADGTVSLAVRRSAIDLKDYDRATTIAKWMDEHKGDHMRALDDARAQGIAPKDLTPEMVMMSMLKLREQKGIIFNDGGRLIVFVADDSSIKRSRDAISERWVRGVDGEGYTDLFAGTPNLTRFPSSTEPWKGPWIQPSQDNMMESLLREAGVSERELEYFRNINPFEDEARGVAQEFDLLGRIMQGAKEVNEKAGPEAIETAAARSGLRVDRTTDGEYRLLTDTNDEILRTGNEATARAYINKMGPDDLAPDLEANSPIKSTAIPHAAGGSVTPPRPFQQMPPDRREGWASRFLDSSQLFLTAFTAMENIAKSAERRGFGPVFTKIFHPIQQALERVDNQLAGIKRDALQGRTFSEQLKLIEKLAEGPVFGKANLQRQELAVRALEAMSKEEIAEAGGLLVRGLSRTEINLADTFEALGLQDDIPRMTGTLRMAKLAVENKADFPRKLMEMQRVEVSPEFRQVLDQLTRMLEDMPDTVDGILRELGLSEREMLATGMIDNILSKGVDDQSLFAISRYASAKPLGKGFKSARDEMMSVQGFTAKERKLVEELERAYKAAFAVSQLNHKKEIGGYWPHMRKWIEQGFGPEEEFIRKHIPESVEWSAERVRTGELDVYLMDPVLTTAKYVRSMLMKQEFDPILPDVKTAVRNLGARDERMHRIFSEYVHEAMGRPHASFRRLHEMISTSTRILTGRVPDERFTRNLINGMGSLFNAAAIPFRPMLIARNYFQMTQMIPPRTGVTEFFSGLRMALTDEGFKEAVEKNIVTKNVLPVHATTEIYGYDTSRLSRRMHRIFQKGFEWYQKPDDIGRAAAFFAARARINKHVDDVFTGKITYETFKQRAKINTYDGVDIKEFDGLWSAGRYEEAKDYIGSRLSRETIFRYGHANHPAGWGSVAGRLYGTFGTWPTQYKDFLLQGMTRGSTRDRLEFLGIHSAVNAATLAAGATVGVDLMSWVAFPSLNYTGGPMADLTVNVIQSFGGSPTEKSLANRNIRMMFPSLENPRSIFIPGSFFLGDLHRMATGVDVEDKVIGGLSLRMLTKDSSNPFQGVWD